MAIDLENGNICGFLLETSKQMKTAIFSIYSPPKEKLNLNIIEYIIKSSNNFIILEC